MKKHKATYEILAALKRGEKITAHTALMRWRVFRLASIIHNLRNAGHDIQTNLVHSSGSRHGEYYIAR